MTWSIWAIIPIIALVGFMRGTIKCIRSRDRELFGSYVTIAVIVTMIWWSLNFLTSTASTTSFHRSISYSSVANKVFNFESGTTYPLVLGNRTSAFEVSTSAHGVLGYFSLSTAIRGGSAVIVDFVHADNVHEPLDIPLSTTHIDDHAKPSIVINLKPHTVGNEGWGQPHLVFSNLAPALQRVFVGPEFLESVRKKGLKELVTAEFESAEFTMTQAMYDEMIGRIK